MTEPKVTDRDREMARVHLVDASLGAEAMAREVEALSFKLAQARAEGYDQGRRESGADTRRVDSIKDHLAGTNETVEICHHKEGPPGPAVFELWRGSSYEQAESLRGAIDKAFPPPPEAPDE